METLKDIFVSQDISEKLLRLGFREPCIALYNFYGELKTVIINEELMVDKKYCRGSFTQSCYSGIPAPTYEQVFKWFLERGYFSHIKKQEVVYHYCISFDGKGCYMQFDTYEETRKQSILKLIEIYKENGNSK